ncbi:MAG: DUF1571 domain-containing protein [Deltaproteobacteria bacterium]|uniref:DUF1571 domain-containing protein n=1 Tax=Candidatus Zymogenus saltonus TaxID=2844893 RepID=A0A9D8PKT7_9DELT|nr:DUF1571 domain-containing protein [Candidatus Zymogenus saltonus]
MKPLKPINPAIAILILTLTLIPLKVYSEHTLEPIDALRKCIGTMKGVNDYILVVHQVQRVGGKLLPEEVILYKFKRPNSVYLRSIGEANNGQEIIYREGWNDGKMMGHLGGALNGIILNLKPGADMANKRSRHTIDKSSLVYMMNTLERSMDYAKAHPEDNMIVEDIGTKNIFGKPVRLIRIKLPHGKDYPYYAPVSIFGIDMERYLPLYYRSYGPDGEMWEDYRYRDLRTNVGLTDLDFDPKNPEYNFQ